MTANPQVDIQFDLTRLSEHLNRIPVHNMDESELRRYLRTYLDTKWDRETNTIILYLRFPSTSREMKHWDIVFGG